MSTTPVQYLGLQTSTLPDSPGSSVFDLPTQRSGIQGERNFSRQTAADVEADAVSRERVKFVVISGGTGGNGICSAFGNASYVLPVSDDGGSSSEIIRVLGGPSIGDIRSRLIRLIPSAPPSSPLEAIRNLLSYRLPSRCTEKQARDEWRDIVEGRSALWAGIPNDRKETIRGFLVYFESELLKRAHKNFSFVNGSIGNYFLAAAQGFFRSLPSAIFLFSSITSSQATILPVIITNHTVTIAAELENGGRLVGQCEISHPVNTGNDPSISLTVNEPEPWSPIDGMDQGYVQRQNVMFEAGHKDQYEPLPARITRLLYINAYGHEVHPSPNPDYISSLSSSEVLVYSCGSLWTSIMPCLALRGVAAAIARSRSIRIKVLLLNSINDRETSGYNAVDYITYNFGTIPHSMLSNHGINSSIVRILNFWNQPQSYGLGGVNTTYPVSAFITDLVYLKESDVKVDVGQITAMGVRCTMVEAEEHDPKAGPAQFDAATLASRSEANLVFPDSATPLPMATPVTPNRMDIPSSLPSHYSSRNSSRSKLVLICSLASEDGGQDIIDLTNFNDDAFDNRATYCLVHEQYLCQHREHPNAMIDLDDADENANIISPAEEPDSSEETDVGQEGEGVPIAIPTVRPGGRVRFRSRVRIASGLHRPHRSNTRDSLVYGACNQLTLGESSLSSSPSSSISAPLRTEATNDAECRPEWGTLGQRVRLFAYRGKGKASLSPETVLEKRERRRRKLGLPPLDPSLYPSDMRSKVMTLPSEGTPLVGKPYARSLYVENEGVQPGDPFYDSDDEEDGLTASARLSREVDRMFGTFPGRLLNRHWWWWQLEPLVTCNCSMPDSDSESSASHRS
ncbi:hypothetical protein ONZ45_g2827 [Pleurotus djamor]|nr:hypothetical protein ONZ45_g2827 [Pleurotus djamor]